MISDAATSEEEAEDAAAQRKTQSDGEREKETVTDLNLSGHV